MIVSRFSGRRITRPQLPRFAPITHWRSWQCPAARYLCQTRRWSGARARLATHIPGAKYVELLGPDHLPSVADMNLIVDEIEEFVTGVRRGPDPDRVLLTGVVHRHLPVHPTARPGDRARAETFERHNALVRRELARYRGRQVTRRVTDSWQSSTAPPAQPGAPWKRHGLRGRWAWRSMPCPYR